MFLLLAMALLMGPLSNVATASRTGPRSTWIPDGGGCGGRRAEDIPPTTAPSNPPAIASCVAVLLLLLSDSLSSDVETDSEGAEVANTDDEVVALVVDVVEGLMMVLPVERRFTSVSTTTVEAVEVLLDNCD